MTSIRLPLGSRGANPLGSLAVLAISLGLSLGACGGDDDPGPGGDGGAQDGPDGGTLVDAQGGADGQAGGDGPSTPGVDSGTGDGPPMAADGPPAGDGAVNPFPPMEPGPADGPGCTVVVAPADLISDFEGGGLAVAEPRAGQWARNVDAYGSEIIGVAAGGACGSGFALRMQGATAEKAAGGTSEAYGAGVAFSFSAPVDASAYSGIRFMARGTAQGQVRVSVYDAAHAPGAGVCTAGACLGAHGLNVSIDGQWGAVEVPFAMLKAAQVGTEPAVPLGAAAVHGLQILVRAPPYGPFDLAIDRVAFIPK